MIWPTWNQQSWEYTYIYIYTYTYWKIIGLCFRYGGVPGTRKAKIIQIVSFLIGKPLWFGVPQYQEAIFFGVWLQWSAMSSVQPQILWISVHCVSAANHIKELRLGALTLADHVSFLLCYAGPFCRLHSSHTFQTHQWTDLWPFTPYSAWKELSACVAWASIRQTQKQQPWI